MHLDLDMALTPPKKPQRRPREPPPRLREKPAARARQVAKGRKATAAGRHKTLKLKVNTDADGLRPPTSAELRCPVSSSTDIVDL